MITLNLLLFKLDVSYLDVGFDDFLWCVACFHSEDPGACLKDAPETLTLDVLWRVAHALGVDLDVKLVPVEA